MNIYEQIDANRQKTWLIMLVFTLIIGALAWLFASALGYEGAGALGYVGFGLLLTGTINFVSYYFSDKMVLALSGAKPVTKKDAPQLYTIVENLCIGAGIPMPKIYIVNDPTPNAFATGRDPQHAAIAVHSGLSEKLDKLEMEGVIAHELSHIRNFDTRLMAIVAILAGTLAMLADFFLRTLWWGGERDRDSKGQAIFMVLGIIAALVAPLAAQLIQMAVSRRREFLADASGALLTRYPEGLAQALEKIAASKTPSPTASTATAHLYFANPLGNKKVGSWVLGLFNTHPPIEERIKILRAM